MIHTHGKVTFEVSGSTGIMTLADPPANKLAFPEFIPIDIFDQWTTDSSLKGLIITGAGKNFSSGGDLDTIHNMAGDTEQLGKLLTAGNLLLCRIENLDIPVIAAINRVCFGGGLEIALACHIRVASENALLAFPEVNHQIMPGQGGTIRATALAGLSQSASLILGGDMITAEDALKLDLIDYIAPKDKALDFALELMQKMTRDRTPLVIRSVMQSLRNSLTMPREEAIREESRLFCILAREEGERRSKEEPEQ